MEKNKKNRTLQKIYNELKDKINTNISNDQAKKITIELLNELVEKLIDDKDWKK